jgi:hypothetical protein
MNTGLKNKLLVMATAAGLAGFGVACGGSSEPPAAEEGATPEATTGSETATDPAAPDATEGTTDPAAQPGAAAPGEGSCGGEGKCS